MSTKVKIRGIYSSALTRFLLDAGYTIVDPSVEIQNRFALDQTAGTHDILIQDKKDLQGIYLIGETVKVCPVVRLLQGSLLDAVMMKLENLEESEGRIRVHMEFPGTSKDTLDEIRSRITPTLARHHRLRIVQAKDLGSAEQRLQEHQERKSAIEGEVFHESILTPLQKKGRVFMDHIRIHGKRIRPREGVLMEADENHILLKRHFSSGRYDGLDLPIENGDYGLTEASEGEWFVKHGYYSKDGDLKGEYYNINTAVEFYPYGARYVDLEVDVVRRAGEPPFMVDQEHLASLVDEGYIDEKLAKKALDVAEDLLQQLQT
jgi:hypothetical protein